MFMFSNTRHTPFKVLQETRIKERFSNSLNKTTAEPVIIHYKTIFYIVIITND